MAAMHPRRVGPLDGDIEKLFGAAWIEAHWVDVSRTYYRFYRALTTT
ncbi:MAG: hypothetical protein K0U93_08675 [Gammaproteobacteria bacterium]|nr:hypothetical protein [Gammaproteobacteria bacterium]